jgi:hypothetical protein
VEKNIVGSEEIAHELWHSSNRRKRQACPRLRTEPHAISAASLRGSTTLGRRVEALLASLIGMAR